MLARISSLELANGNKVETPQLVPSFSSKGFGFVEEDDGNEISAISQVLELFGPTIESGFLISAFDIKQRNLKLPNRFFKSPSFVLVDSGGYELVTESDPIGLGPSYAPHLEWQELEDETEQQVVVDDLDSVFSLEDYKRVLQDFDGRNPMVITNFDWKTHGLSLDKQMEESDKLFNYFEHFSSNFLIKPQTDRRNYLNIDQIAAHSNDLVDYDIVGVTEKELGRSLVERLANLSLLSKALRKKREGVSVHVWGGLDPVVTPLYFMAGGDFFDGLSWIRYTFRNGFAASTQAFSVVEESMNMERNKDKLTMRRLAQNLEYLERLRNQCRDFVKQGFDFDVFEFHGQLYKEIMTKVQAKVEG